MFCLYPACQSRYRHTPNSPSLRPLLNSRKWRKFGVCVRRWSPTFNILILDCGVTAVWGLLQDRHTSLITICSFRNTHTHSSKHMTTHLAQVMLVYKWMRTIIITNGTGYSRLWVNAWGNSWNSAMDVLLYQVKTVMTVIPNLNKITLHLKAYSLAGHLARL